MSTPGRGAGGPWMPSGPPVTTCHRRGWPSVAEGASISSTDSQRVCTSPTRWGACRAWPFRCPGSTCEATAATSWWRRAVTSAGAATAGQVLLPSLSCCLAGYGYRRRRPPPSRWWSHDRRSGASAYGSAALARELDAVRRLVVGERNHGLNRAAFCLGQLVGGGELAADLVHRELLTAALSTGLSESEASRTIRSGLGAGEQQPRRAPSDSARGRANRRTEGAEGGGG